MRGPGIASRGARVCRRHRPAAHLLRHGGRPDPRTGFVPVQQRLARGDALGRYLVHEASSLFVVPGGLRPGGHVGQALLEDDLP
ncbi:hypothetical protein ACFY04_13235 [Streptomyces sp. NPDC001549]|uniref:hypothetical protein n=1 Tax=Streptomyces sp. NPDC001549 TaxID=3364586 RepID=UPI003690D7F2